jgi:hypothetical protein
LSRGFLKKISKNFFGGDGKLWKIRAARVARGTLKQKEREGNIPLSY